MVQSQKEAAGAVPCPAPCAGIWLSWELLARRWGSQSAGVGGCSAAELAEMAAADREHPTARDVGAGVARLARAATDGVVIAATVFAKENKGFGKPTCCQISAPINFFKRKGMIFVLRTSA